jgi:hypothetical protein
VWTGAEIKVSVGHFVKICWKRWVEEVEAEGEEGVKRKSSGHMIQDGGIKVFLFFPSSVLTSVCLLLPPSVISTTASTTASATEFPPAESSSGNQNPRPRQNTNQGSRPREMVPRQRPAAVAATQDVIEQRQVKDKDLTDAQGKVVKVVYFNCVQWGHFSADCKEPRLGFICQTTDHVGRECPEWDKPLEYAQYLGSAAQGLGFFYVDVAEEVNRVGYMRFLENCAILTVEEGDISEVEIVKNLQKLFDPVWHWQLKEIEEFKFLVRFPPQKQIADTLISDTTYFKMNKAGVLVSLKA